MLDGVKPGQSVGVGEPLGVELRGSGMGLVGTWPKDAVASPFPGDSRIVVGSARRHPSHLLEDFPTPDEIEMTPPTETARQVPQQVDVAAPRRGSDGLIAAYDPAFDRRDRAFLLGERGARQHDRRMTGRLGQERIDDHDVFQRGHLFLDPVEVGGRDAHVVGDRQQPLDLAPAGHLEDLGVGGADAGKFIDIDPPTLGHHDTMVRVRDRATGRELVAALSPFPSTLAVALAGEHVDPRARSPRQTAGEGDVDHGEHVVGPHRLLLGTACMQDHAALGRRDRARQVAHGVRSDIGRGFDHLRCPSARRRDGVVEPDGTAPDVVEQTLTFDLGEQADEQRTVGAGPDRDLHVVVLHPPPEPWIDRDHPRPSTAGLVDRRRQHHRIRIGEIGADDDDHIRMGQLGQWSHRPVASERRHVRAPGRDHAEPAIVVDVAGAERESCELAHEVGLLVGQRTARQHGVGVGAVVPADAHEPVSGEIERILVRADRFRSVSALRRFRSRSWHRNSRRQRRVRVGRRNHRCCQYAVRCRPGLLHVGAERVAETCRQCPQQRRTDVVVVFGSDAVDDMTLRETGRNGEQSIDVVESPDDHAERRHQLAALLVDVAGEHRLDLRGDLEESTVEQRRRPLRDRFDLGERILDEGDLFGVHAVSPYEDVGGVAGSSVNTTTLRSMTSTGQTRTECVGSSRHRPVRRSKRCLWSGEATTGTSPTEPTSPRASTGIPEQGSTWSMAANSPSASRNTAT